MHDRPAVETIWILDAKTASRVYNNCLLIRHLRRFWDAGIYETLVIQIRIRIEERFEASVRICG